jgi:hypothetical protein
MKMDDIYGILFYLLIIVLGGIISAYRNKNKRKMRAPTPSRPSEDSELNEIPASGYDPFEVLTKKFEFKIDEPEVESVPEPEVTVQPEAVSLETSADTPEEEGIAVFEETREVMQSDYKEEDEGQDYNLISRGQISDMDEGSEFQKQGYFNLAGDIKQAIIYSEILKRKHF